jgi:hypothetical protein
MILLNLIPLIDVTFSTPTPVNNSDGATPSGGSIMRLRQEMNKRVALVSLLTTLSDGAPGDKQGTRPQTCYL